MDTRAIDRMLTAVPRADLGEPVARVREALRDVALAEVASAPRSPRVVAMSLPYALARLGRGSGLWSDSGLRENRKRVPQLLRITIEEGAPTVRTTSLRRSREERDDQLSGSRAYALPRRRDGTS